MRNVLSKYSANHPPNPVRGDQSVTAVSRLAVTSGAATVGVVGVRTPQKFKLGVSDTSKKLTGNITRSAIA